MKKIIAYRTENMTPNKEWDYVAHYDGDCEDGEHGDPFAYGKTEQEAIKNFVDDLDTLGDCYICDEPIDADDQEYRYFNDGDIAHRDCHRDAN